MELSAQGAVHVVLQRDRFVDTPIIWTLLVALMMAAASACGQGHDGTEATDNPLLSVSVKVGKAEFEIGERTDHTLIIRNQTAGVVTVPSFRFHKGKRVDADFAFYLQEQILRMQVSRGTAAVPIKKRWRTPPERPREFPTVELKPGEFLSERFSLTRKWEPSFYPLDEPGEYALTVTLDTSSVDDDKVVKGIFTSPRAPFRVIPVPTFRKRRPNESQADYAGDKVAFYLQRIRQDKGEGLPNIWNILVTEEAVPALIEALDSEDDATAQDARMILRRTHHSLESPAPPALPDSAKEWREWWQTEGMNLSPQELLHNLDSHWQ